MDLLLPHTGTVVWMFIAFLIVFLILKKFAWKPILDALKDREDSIQDALQAADLAKKDMAKLQADNEKVIARAKSERDQILKEAKEMKESIIGDAKEQATKEADALIKNARESIKNEKDAAFQEIKEQMASLSISIAEKLLQERLANNQDQKDLIDKLLRETKLN